jgi:hypothetical protein
MHSHGPALNPQLLIALALLLLVGLVAAHVLG